MGQPPDAPIMAVQNDAAFRRNICGVARKLR
jgi:hypothetical protein